MKHWIKMGYLSKFNTKDMTVTFMDIALFIVHIEKVFSSMEEARNMIVLSYNFKGSLVLNVSVQIKHNQERRPNHERIIFTS